jgi:hypothetical protein
MTLVRTDVSEERIASTIRVERISALGTFLFQKYTIVSLLFVSGIATAPVVTIVNSECTTYRGVRIGLRNMHGE